ncbi:hypothetical protein AVEN_197837-1 [Araneus ventricosus]|uniref:Uncharacterized protein n=1 Tax=Araneus ventricosus TaxID=182803 RepID=A0A4Y2PJX0_ARAVE|nr:hypothetical protein AVEN_197837-1 [Araneus ventricosus]
MQKEEYGEWMSIDEDIPSAATLTDLEICQAVCEQDRAIQVGDSDEDEYVEENLPSNAEMRQALDILKRGVQHRSTNFKKQYDYAGEGETAPFWGSIRESLGENTPAGFILKSEYQIAIEIEPKQLTSPLRIFAAKLQAGSNRIGSSMSASFFARPQYLRNSTNRVINSIVLRKNRTT